MKKSDKLKQKYKSLNYWWRGFYDASWKHMNVVRGQNIEERREIEELLFEIKEKIQKVYGPLIGDAVMEEIRTE